VVGYKRIKTLGDHNLENVMAALLATVLSGVSVHQACQSASKFEPSDHRCQLVGVVKGVKYINDSKATNVDATRQALKMVPEGKKTWLIAGGKIKDLISEDWKIYSCVVCVEPF
jgi:UDP-N-acetylmuramoylalanine--D-glutamate ligase